jgi:myosin-5
MAHCIARTSLRKLYTWGDNSNGQLGLGHFYRVTKPKLLDYFSKQAITIQQAATSAYGSIALDSHNRLYWWGTNNSIKNMPFPKEVYLFEKVIIH